MCGESHGGRCGYARVLQPTAGAVTLIAAALLMVVVAIPILKYEWLPSVASGALTGLASAYGVDLKVGEWSGDLYDLKATAHDVTIDTHGQYAQSTLLHADAIVLDLGLWRRIRTGHWVQGVEIDGPRLYLEHSLSSSTCLGKT